MYGQDWLLDGSGSYDDDPGDTIVSWEWDLNGDSIYGDVEGDMVTLTQSDYDTWLGTLGPIELDIPYGFRLKVTDTMDNTSSAMGSVTFVVPEPATISLLLLGGVALVRRRP